MSHVNTTFPSSLSHPASPPQLTSQSLQGHCSFASLPEGVIAKRVLPWETARARARRFYASQLSSPPSIPPSSPITLHVSALAKSRSMYGQLDRVRTQTNCQNSRRRPTQIPLHTPSFPPFFPPTPRPTYQSIEQVQVPLVQSHHGPTLSLGCYPPGVEDTAVGHAMGALLRLGFMKGERKERGGGEGYERARKSELKLSWRGNGTARALEYLTTRAILKVKE